MEIEAKVKLKNPVKLRNALKSAGALFHGRCLEKNWLYDYPDRSFVRSDKLLRLRQDNAIHVTFKGPRQESEYKEREELEFDFPDVAFAHGLLCSLGFIKWLYYEKLRETWTLDPCEIVMDELPRLGIMDGQTQIGR